MYGVVLAAGRGTRMRPLTDRRPKPLLPVGDRSLLERVFDTARDVVDEFVVVTGYRGDAVRDSVGESYRDRPVHYVEQAEAVGTAHAVAQAEPIVDDDFLVLNGEWSWTPRCRGRSLRRARRRSPPPRCRTRGRTACFRLARTGRSRGSSRSRRTPRRTSRLTNCCDSYLDSQCDFSTELYWLILWQ